MEEEEVVQQAAAEPLADEWQLGDPTPQQPQYVTREDLAAMVQELKGGQQPQQDPDEFMEQIRTMVNTGVQQALQPIAENMAAQQAMTSLEGNLSRGLNDAGKQFVSETLSKFNPQAIRVIAGDKSQQDILRLAAEGAAARKNGKGIPRSEPNYEGDGDEGEIDSREFEKSWRLLSSTGAIPDGVTKDAYRKEYAKSYGRER